MQATATSTPLSLLPPAESIGHHLRKSPCMRILLCGAPCFARIPCGAISCSAIDGLSSHNSRDYVVRERERVNTHAEHQAGESKALGITPPTDVNRPARTVLSARYRADQGPVVYLPTQINVERVLRGVITTGDVIPRANSECSSSVSCHEIPAGVAEFESDRPRVFVDDRIQLISRTGMKLRDDRCVILRKGGGVGLSGDGHAPGKPKCCRAANVDIFLLTVEHNGGPHWARNELEFRAESPVKVKAVSRRIKCYSATYSVELPVGFESTW